MFNQIWLTESKLLDILEQLGIRIAYETTTDYICYCCFHSNTDSPAFNISKQGPAYLWKCWNGHCNQQGNIFSLFTKKGYTNSEAKKILLFGLADIDEFVDQITALMQEEKVEHNDWLDEDPLRFIEEDKAHGYPAKQYILSRNISEEAYEFFKLGYSAKKHMVVIPVFNEYNMWVGVIGRRIHEKRYQYSIGMERSKLIWNLNNSKEYDEVVLTEGAFDSIALWDAGIKNVASVGGSSVSEYQWHLLRKYFGGLCCFFDNDPAGNSLRDSILGTISDLLLSTVSYPHREILLADGSSRSIKDPGELSNEEIKYMLDNRVDSITMLLNMV